MLRLAHRLLQRHRPGLWGDDETAQRADEAIGYLPTAQVIVADEVCEFVSSQIKNLGHVDLRDNIPNYAPPFPNIWIEFYYDRPSAEDKEATTGHVGVMVMAREFVPQMSLRELANKGGRTTWDTESPLLDEPLRWVLHTTAFTALKRDSMALGIRGGWPCALVSPAGALVDMRFLWPSDVEIPNRDNDERAMTHLMAIVGYTLSFMHCKNVVAVDATDEIGPPAKWLRRQRVPALTYRVLRIAPMAQIIKKHAQDTGTSIDKAMHICRGHFRTYGDDSPGLFGKYHGTFWVPNHVRGSREHGEVIKDYAINVKEREECESNK